MASPWDAYKDNLLAGDKLTEAALYGLNGSKWTASDGLASLSVQEVSTIVNGFTDDSKLRETGIHVGGKKYMFLRCEGDAMQGKKGQTGITIAKCNQCVIFGVYGEGQQPGAAAVAVGNVGDYLKGQGY